MRVFQIELPATIVSTDPDLVLSSPAVREQLHRELERVAPQLAEDIRSRASSYFPPEFTVFARFRFPPGGQTARAVIWIDDPIIRWPAGLFARRAWKLSIPIVAHIAKEVFATHLQSVRLEVDERKARVVSFAPARGWLDPVVLAVVLTAANALFWLYGLPALTSWLAAAPQP